MTEENIKPILHTTWFGTFIIKNGEVIDYRLFPKEPRELYNRRKKRQEGYILEEERELAGSCSDGVLVTSSRNSDLGTLIHRTVPDVLPSDYSYDDTLLHEMLKVTGEDELRSSHDPGEHIAKAINSIKDFNETINILNERLRDWYALHFPELIERVDDEEFLRLISRWGKRGSISLEEDIKADSVGGDISDDEARLYRELAQIIITQKTFRSELTEYLEMKMETEAPSLTTLVGPKLGAELIAQAGSLKKLALMPSSTIQLLGAEKSLFRHLKKGTPPPKHGHILQHPYVHRSPPGTRGKAARLLANKVAIAARVDYFKGEPVGKELKVQIESKLDTLGKGN